MPSQSTAVSLAPVLECVKPTPGLSNSDYPRRNSGRWAFWLQRSKGFSYTVAAPRAARSPLRDPASLLAGAMAQTKTNALRLPRLLFAALAFLALGASMVLSGCGEATSDVTNETNATREHHEHATTESPAAETTSDR